MQDRRSDGARAAEPAGARVSRPKMADIAAIAGVSVGTVSRALAGSPLVTEETRRRIQAAVQETGYVVNHAASGLRLQRSRQLLILLPSIANLFFAEVVLGAEEMGQAHSYGMLIGNTGGDPAREEAFATQMRNGAVDGMLLLTGRRPELLRGYEDRAIAISERIPGSGIGTVSVDNVAAAAEATRHLIELGHRRIAHITGPAGNILTAARLKGYGKALAAAGLPVDKELITGGDFTIASGEAAMQRLLPLRPSAIFCSNDEMAIGAIKAARAVGLGVPADLSLVGFDDIPIVAAYDPPLTTIRQPRRALGRVAMSLLLGAFDGTPVPARPVLLAHELILRGSTAPPAAARRRST